MQVRDLTKMGFGTQEFLRVDIVDASPMTWFVQVDGLIMDARELPAPVQAQAFELGVIPYIPALGRDGTAVWLSQNERARLARPVVAAARSRCHRLVRTWRLRPGAGVNGGTIAAARSPVRRAGLAEPAGGHQGRR
jgi:hypothetical protein